MCDLAVCAGLIKPIVLTEAVDHCLKLQPGLIEKGCVLRKANVLRGNGRITDLCGKECTAFPASSSCIEEPGNRIAQQVICLDHELEVDSFSPLNQQGWDKRCLMLESFQTNEELIVRVLRDLIHQFTVGITHPALKDQ